MTTIGDDESEKYEMVRLVPDDAPEILDFLVDDFLIHESLNAAIELRADEASQFFEEIIKASLESPLSYALRRGDGRIVALRLATILHRDDTSNNYIFASHCNFNSEAEATTSDNNWKIKAIQHLLTDIEGRIWDLVDASIKTLAAWLILSVHTAHTRRGLARRLLEHRLDEARAQGCEGVVCTTSAIGSQRLLEKLGYTSLYTVQLANWLDKSGAVIFEPSDGTTKVELVFKSFEVENSH